MQKKEPARGNTVSECSECYAPLKPGEVAVCERCTRNAGVYHEAAAYNSETDAVDWRKVKITCPFCGREFAAMLSKFTKTVRALYDYDGDPSGAEMETFCRVCKNEITFRLYM